MAAAQTVLTATPARISTVMLACWPTISMTRARAVNEPSMPATGINRADCTPEYSRITENRAAPLALPNSPGLARGLRK